MESVPTPTSAWDDIVSLANELGAEIKFETRVVDQPVIQCTPRAYDAECPPDHPWPNNWFDPDTLEVCATHNEFWPCSVIDINGGYTYLQPTTEQVLVVKWRKDTP